MTNLSNDKYIIGYDPFDRPDNEVSDIITAFEMKYLTEEELTLILKECRK
jgi:hypothetical protein